MRPLGAAHSLNFVACHDGLALADVVSFARRTNTDGYDEQSFNCGIEGLEASRSVHAKRARTLRNFFLTLAVARGVPMITQGDELGFSKGGNSNSWNDPECFVAPLPDDPRGCPRAEGLVLFAKQAFALRLRMPALTGLDFYERLVWVDGDGQQVHEPTKGVQLEEPIKDLQLEEPIKGTQLEKPTTDTYNSVAYGTTNGNFRSCSSTPGLTHPATQSSRSTRKQRYDNGFVAFLTSSPDTSSGNESPIGELVYVAFNNRRHNVSARLPRVKGGQVSWRVELDTNTHEWKCKDLDVKSDGDVVEVAAGASVFIVGTRRHAQLSDATNESEDHLL